MKKIVISMTVLALSLGMTVMAAEENDDWFQKNYEFRKDYDDNYRFEERKEYYEENGAYIMPCGIVGFGPLMSTPGKRIFQDQRFGLQSRRRMFKGRGCGPRNR